MSIERSSIHLQNRFSQDLAEIQELQEKEEIIIIKPKGANKGGLVVEINGVQAFLPASQLASEHYPKISGDDKSEIVQSLQELIGVAISVKIIDANPRTNKCILSERAATEISIKELAKNYTVGQVIEGVVSGVADFGAFIKFTDNPEVEGLIHISELDYKVIENPKEVIKVDDVVKAKIIDIKEGKISLSLKALKADPWENADKIYKEGQTVTGKVYAIQPFGAIVSLDQMIQGQIHVSQFGGVPEMKQVLGVGKEYAFVIESVKPQEKRILLKLKK